MKKILTAIIAAAILSLGCRPIIAPIIAGKITEIQKISYNVGDEVHELQRVKIMFKGKIYIAVTKGEQKFEIEQDIRSKYVPVPEGKVDYNIFDHNAEEGHMEADMILPPEY